MSENIEIEKSYRVRVLFGHVEPEQRYVKVGDNSIVCESRCRTFNSDGLLVSETEWSPLSIMTNVPDDLMAQITGNPARSNKRSWWRRLFDA